MKNGFPHAPRAKSSPIRLTAITWAEFLDLVSHAQARMSPAGARPGSCEEIFYRGHSESSWPLLPTLLRHADKLKLSDEELLAVESDLFWEFQARAQELHDHVLSDWDYLFFMRHHGAYTRLLDWTESLGVALYFALGRKHPGLPVPLASPTLCSQ